MGLNNNISINGPTNTAATKGDPLVNAAITYLNSETDALRNSGFSEDQVKFNLIKDYMESGAYTNSNSKNFNPGNITWSKNSKTAKKGKPFGKGWWAVYSNLDDYATDLMRVLSLSPGRPIDATGYPDLTDYAKRLGINGYFGFKPEQGAKYVTESMKYLKAMQGAQQRLKIIESLISDTNQKIVPGTKPPIKIPWGWIGGGIVGLMALSAIFKSARD